MEFLPRTMGTRPRLACEVRSEGVVAARAEDASAVLEAVSQAPLAAGTVLPQLHGDDAGSGAAPANGQASVRGALGSGSGGHDALVQAMRSALEQVSARGREITLVVPDAAARVLLLDFDELPAKTTEALPVVRFRLKKLLPFDADEAVVSYQVMSNARGSVQVLAVAMPHEVLDAYESAVREAGFEPGAVLPSTLAALAAMSEGDAPRLVVNAGREGVTTAIVKGNVLLLHRRVEVSAGGGQADEVAQAVSVAAAYFEDTLETAPTVLLVAGTLGADALTSMLDQAKVGPVAVQEMVERGVLGAGAETAGRAGGVPLGWLAGVRGALAS